MILKQLQDAYRLEQKTISETKAGPRANHLSYIKYLRASDEITKKSSFDYFLERRLKNRYARFRDSFFNSEISFDESIIGRRNTILNYFQDHFDLGLISSVPDVESLLTDLIALENVSNPNNSPVSEIKSAVYNKMCADSLELFNTFKNERL